MLNSGAPVDTRQKNHATPRVGNVRNTSWKQFGHVTREPRLSSAKERTMSSSHTAATLDPANNAATKSVGSVSVLAEHSLDIVVDSLHNSSLRLLSEKFLRRSRLG